MQVFSEITGTVWKVVVAPGQVVAQGDTLLIVESMKMEIPVEATSAGTVQEIFVQEGEMVEDGMAVVRLA
jgi:acetyl-CoA carboxylase biotin carboxyl carrier protein